MKTTTRLLIAVLLCVSLSSCNVLFPFSTSPSDALTGNVIRGEAIFRQGVRGSPPCVSCHVLTPGAYALGPSLKGIGARAGGRVKGLAATAYLRQSILKPEVYLVPGYRSIMFSNYGEIFTEQDLLDLIAFLQTL